MRLATDSQEFVNRAATLTDQLRERRAETQELRRLPDATVAEMRELELPLVMAPPENGGADLGADAVFEIARELGRGCGSTAWVFGVYAVHAPLVSMFPIEAQREVFGGDRAPLISTGFSPLRGKTETAEGGAILSGQWDFSSGVDHADWVVVVAVGEQGPLGHLVPASEMEIVDTWQTAGMAGSGSKDVACKGLFVPEHRLVSMVGVAQGRSLGTELYDSPWFRLPLSSYFAAGVVGSILGMGRGALEVFGDRTKEKIGGVSGIKLADRTDVHLRVGEAAAQLDAADMVARGTYAEIKTYASEEREIPPEVHVGWMKNIAWSGHSAMAGIDLLFEVGGAHVLWSDDQLCQFQRDANAGVHHYALSRHTFFTAAGRTMIGLDHGLSVL